MGQVFERFTGWPPVKLITLLLLLFMGWSVWPVDACDVTQDGAGPAGSAEMGPATKPGQRGHCDPAPAGPGSG